MSHYREFVDHPVPPGITPGGQPLGKQTWGLEDEQAGYRSRGGPRTAAVRCPPGNPCMDVDRSKTAQFTGEINIVGNDQTFHVGIGMFIDKKR